MSVPSSSSSSSPSSPRESSDPGKQTHLIDFSSRELVNFGDPTVITRLERIEQHSKHMAKNPWEVWLLLHNNSLTDVAFIFGFSFVSNLSVLTLYDNNLSCLPDLTPLKSLTVLSARQNQLETLPPSVGSLTKLTCLYLQSNCITHLPDELGLCASLHLIDLSDNPLDGKDGSLSALMKDPQSSTRLIVDFCRSKLEENNSLLPSFRDRIIPPLNDGQKSRSVQNLREKSKVDTKGEEKKPEPRESPSKSSRKPSSNRRTFGPSSGTKMKPISKEEQIEYALQSWINPNKK